MMAKCWKQPKYPWAGDWVTKLWYLHTTESYSAVKGKKNKVADTQIGCVVKFQTHQLDL